MVFTNSIQFETMQQMYATLCYNPTIA